MKILITGASGFLGKHLCQRLEKDGHRLTRVDSKSADLRRQDSLEKFNDSSFDQIYHLAAWTQAGDFCLHHQGEQWIINQQLNTHVLGWWQQRQPQAKLIAMGSSCCYPTELELVEENFLKGEPIESLYTYGMTKRMLYVGMRSLHQQFGLKYLCLVPSTLYGSDYHLDGRQMHFIFDLVRKILEGKYRGSPVQLWGDGHQAREISHVRDFVSAAVALAGKVDNNLINVGSGEEHTIRWYADIICKLVGYDPAMIQYDTSKYVGARSKVMSIRRLKTFLPLYSVTPVQEGLAEVVEWLAKAQGYKKG